MKALKVIATTIVSVALLGSSVLAAAPSPTVKGAVKIKSAKTASGKDITANLVITPMSEMGSTTYAEVKAYLQSASDDFKAANDLVKDLKGTDGATLEAKLKSLSGMDDVSTLKATEIVDVSYVENGKVVALPEETTIEFECADANIVLHQVKAGAWTAEGSLTTKVTTLSPFAFLSAKASKSDNKSGSDDGQKSPQTGEYVTKAVLAGAVILAAAGIVCVVRAKKSSAN